MIGQIFWLLALLAPIMHFCAECVRAFFRVFADCFSVPNYSVNDVIFTSNDVCWLTHPDFIYICLIIIFVYIPWISALVFGEHIFERYMDCWALIHRTYVKAMFSDSLVLILLLFFLFLTCLLGYGFAL
ncbi:NS7 protein [Megaderma bat coronavirus]|nr:NS7 protein [Megaderma bat coronavirus]